MKNIVGLIKGNPLLVGILFFSFLLRIAGILWSIPFPNPTEIVCEYSPDEIVWGYHPDEPQVIWRAVGFPSDILTNSYLVYPTFFGYFLGVLTLPLRFLYHGLGLSSSEFYWSVTVIGRFISTLAGTSAVLLTYLLARDIYDKKRALLAGAFLSISLYHVQSSSFATTDVLTSFFFVLFLYILGRAFLKPENTSLYILAGFVFGLLVGTKYTGIMAIIVMLVLYVYTVLIKSKNEKNQGNIDMRKWHLNLLVFGCVAAAIFFITTPGIILHFNDFINSMLFLKTDLGRYQHSITDSETWSTVFDNIKIAIGFPLASLFLFGIFLPFKKNIYEVGFIVLLIAFFMSFGRPPFPRYYILVIPLMVMIASNGVLWLYSLQRIELKVLSVLVISFVIAYSIGYCLTGAYLRYNDTRSQAARFIQENIPIGESIGLGYQSEGHGSKECLWGNVQIDFTRFSYMDFLDYPKIVVISSIYFRQIEASLESDKLSKDYIWDKSYNKEWWKFSPPSPRVFKFYDDLLNPERSKYTLLKTFKKSWYVPIWPHTAEFASPEVRIYVRKF